MSILKLDRDVAESEEIGYICISNSTYTAPGADLYAIGWGFTSAYTQKRLFQLKF